MTDFNKPDAALAPVVAETETITTTVAMPWVVVEDFVKRPDTIGAPRAVPLGRHGDIIIGPATAVWTKPPVSRGKSPAVFIQNAELINGDESHSAELVIPQVGLLRRLQAAVRRKRVTDITHAQLSVSVPASDVSRGVSQPPSDSALYYTRTEHRSPYDSTKNFLADPRHGVLPLDEDKAFKISKDHGLKTISDTIVAAEGNVLPVDESTTPQDIALLPGESAKVLIHRRGLARRLACRILGRHADYSVDLHQQQATIKGPGNSKI